jgi:hypothetical protein
MAGDELISIGGAGNKKRYRDMGDGTVAEVVNAGPSANVFKSVAATVITNETTVWTPTSGKKFCLLGFVITQGVATGNITLRDNTAGATILTIPATPVGQPLPVPLGAGIISAAANNVLTAQGVSTETISGFFYGIEL